MLMLFSISAIKSSAEAFSLARLEQCQAPNEVTNSKRLDSLKLQLSKVGRSQIETRKRIVIWCRNPDQAGRHSNTFSKPLSAPNEFFHLKLHREVLVSDLFTLDQ